MQFIKIWGMEEKKWPVIFTNYLIPDDTVTEMTGQDVYNSYFILKDLIMECIRSSGENYSAAEKCQIFYSTIRRTKKGSFFTLHALKKGTTAIKVSQHSGHGEQ